MFRPLDLADGNKDGLLQPAELAALVAKLELPVSAAALLAAADTDKDGAVRGETLTERFSVSVSSGAAPISPRPDSRSNPNR